MKPRSSGKDTTESIRHFAKTGLPVMAEHLVASVEV
jgi:hypothetical protein